ncbi:MAG: endonuclease III [Coxiella endosymbiont of Haemaphysalis qinghaiensis]
MNQNEHEEIFRRFKARNAKPASELMYRSEFELLMAVMLSAQATDTGVNKSTKELFKVANSPLKMLNLGEEGLKNYIKSIGLYNTKAKNIIHTCKILVEEYHSQIPKTRIEIEALPGVGRKTANIILNTVFGYPTVAVDTHVFRVANRTGLASGKTPLAVENKLTKVVSKKYLASVHHWLVLHGRYICTARRPKCLECFISDLCEYPNKINY